MRVGNIQVFLLALGLQLAVDSFVNNSIQIKFFFFMITLTVTDKRKIYDAIISRKQLMSRPFGLNQNDDG